LQDRLQESRREFKVLRAEMELMKEQMMALRQPVAEKSETTQQATPAKKAAKKAGSKKKAVAKRSDS
ncbi:MAG: hypothetical protein PVF13_08900, partial [Chromatiales bacterium]